MKNHILVVDEDQLILYALAKILKGKGYEVATAESAAKAVEKLSFCPYDLCLLDVRLPDLEGIELIKIIREMCPAIKIVIMTANSRESTDLEADHHQAAAGDANRFLAKPFDSFGLLEVVQQVLTGTATPQAEADFSYLESEDSEKSRKCGRRRFNEKIIFQMSVVDHGDFVRQSIEGRIIDINDFGIGLLTRYPLAKSQVVGFDEKLDKRVGVVAWSRKIDDEFYRVGIKFA